MSTEIHNCQMYDTVTETYFGPVCESDEEAAQLHDYIWNFTGEDPREASGLIQLAALVDIRKGQMQPDHPTRLCLCGSGKRWWTKTLYHDGKVETSCGPECLLVRAKYLTGKVK